MKRGKIILITIITILVLLFIIRSSSPKEIDDVHPNRPCEKEYLEKSDILWIMPNYLNIPISSNQTWCQQTLSLNKTIGMHGITNEINEFEITTYNKSEFNSSLEEFKKCFGKYPTMFKAPNLKISEQNKDLVKSFNLTLRTPYHQTIHKVYHCNEAGVFPNWFHDIF